MGRWLIVNGSTEHTSKIILGRQYDEFSFELNGFEERCSEVVGNKGSGIWKRNQKRSFGFKLW